MLRGRSGHRSVVHFDKVNGHRRNLLDVESYLIQAVSQQHKHWLSDRCLILINLCDGLRVGRIAAQPPNRVGRVEDDSAPSELNVQESPRLSSLRIASHHFVYFVRGAAPSAHRAALAASLVRGTAPSPHRAAFQPVSRFPFLSDSQPDSAPGSRHAAYLAAYFSRKWSILSRLSRRRSRCGGGLGPGDR